MPKAYEHKKTVYLSDTDATGIVYYARQLDWMEEARVEFLRTFYKPLTRMIQEDGVSFIPVNVNINYKKPAVFEDELIIKVSIKQTEKISLILEYEISKTIDPAYIVSQAEINMLCVDQNKGGKPCRIPEAVKWAVDAWETKEK